MVSNTEDECLQRKIAQKIFKSKIEARPVNAGHYMAFKHRISFATDLIAKLSVQTLVAINLESCQTSFPSFCALPSEVAVLSVLFYSNLNKALSLDSGQVIDLYLLLCTGSNPEQAVLFLCHIFTQRPLND